MPSAGSIEKMGTDLKTPTAPATPSWRHVVGVIVTGKMSSRIIGFHDSVIATVVFLATDGLFSSATGIGPRKLRPLVNYATHGVGIRTHPHSSHNHFVNSDFAGLTLITGLEVTITHHTLKGVLWRTTGDRSSRPQIPWHGTPSTPHKGCVVSCGRNSSRGRGGLTRLLPHQHNKTQDKGDSQRFYRHSSIVRRLFEKR